MLGWWLSRKGLVVANVLVGVVLDVVEELVLVLALVQVVEVWASDHAVGVACGVLNLIVSL